MQQGMKVSNKGTERKVLIKEGSNTMMSEMKGVRVGEFFSIIKNNAQDSQEQGAKRERNPNKNTRNTKTTKYTHKPRYNAKQTSMYH